MSMISFVIPVYNERESLATLHEELAGVVAARGLGDAEFVFIDDGSRDGSWQVLRELAGRDPRVRAIRFRRNFGKAAALTAGFGRARGDVIFTLDADLQDDPAEVPRFLELLEQGDGLDVISGWKRTRHDPWHKVFPSRVFNWMVSRLTGTHLHDHNCGYKCYRAEVLREVFIYGELHRFVPVLAGARGFRVGEIEVHHRARQFGRSKYGFSRFVKGFLDLLTVRFLTGFGQRPQHVLGVFGLILLSIGLLGLGYLAGYWVYDHWIMGDDHPIGSRPLLTYSVALLVVGMQLVSLGVLAELVTSYNLRAEDTFSVAEAIDPEAGTAPAADAPPPGSSARGRTHSPRPPAPAPPPARRPAPPPRRPRPPPPPASGPWLLNVLIELNEDRDPMANPELPDTVYMEPDGSTRVPPRTPARRAFGQILIVVSVALALGATLKQRAMISANDISRWCTVWALLERGTYAIDECPWQLGTQDKVLLPDPFAPEGEEAPKRFYSSKPPLLPTIIAGILYPARAISGVPLEAKTEQGRSLRKEVQSLADDPPSDPNRILEVDEERGYRVIDVTPEDLVEWPVQVLYFNPVVVLLNVVPMLVMLVLYGRLLDRYAANDWAWFLSMAAAGLGTNLVIFTTTLNNHTIAAWSAFFALYALLRIWDDGRTHWGYFASAGFFGAFAACNELPAALFGALLFLLVLVKSPGKTFAAFVPAALVPLVAFMATIYLAIGEWTPVYAKFSEEGPDSPYRYPGSYWLTPLGMDWFDQNPEPWWVYLLHLTIGHHGIFSLTPVVLFSFWGMFRSMLGFDGRLRILSWLTFVLSTTLIAFYVWQTHNYGGSTQGARWLFWLFPFWLILLPLGFEGGQARPWVRWLTLAALGFAVFNTGYGIHQPWSHPWIVDAMEHLGWYELKR